MNQLSHVIAREVINQGRCGNRKSNKEKFRALLFGHQRVILLCKPL